MNRTLARFCRLCLLFFAVFFVGISVTMGIVAAAMFPQVLILFALAVFYFGGRRLPNLWSHGTARWGTIGDCRGMVESNGLPLGTLPPPTMHEGFKAIFSLKDHEAACRVFLASQKKQPVWVAASQFTHACIFSPPGGGKTTAVVIPYALQCTHSMVLTDPKGEVFLATHNQRRAMGHRVVLLDPFGITKYPTDTFNPLDLIDSKSPFALDDVRVLSDAIVIRNPEAKEPHWDEKADAEVTGCMALLSSFTDPAARDLNTVATVLASEPGRAKAIAAMQASGAFGGMLARLGNQMAGIRNDELPSVLSTANRHLKWLSSPAVATNLSASSFDAKQLVDGKMTIYLVLPPDKLATLQGLLRVWIASFLTVLTRSGVKKDKRVVFLLDESASIGPMQCLQNAIAQLRGYGLSLVFIWQALGQLELMFPKGQAATFLAQMDVTIYAATRDYQTAEHVSKQLGETTIRTKSVSDNTTHTVNYDPFGSATTSRAANDGTSIQTTGRALLKPDEVLQLDQRQAIVFTPNTPPLLTRLERYYEKPFRRRHRWPWLMVVRCVCFGLLTLMCIVIAVLVATKHSQTKTPAAPPTIQSPPAIQPAPKFAPKGDQKSFTI